MVFTCHFMIYLNLHLAVKNRFATECSVNPQTSELRCLRLKNVRQNLCSYKLEICLQTHRLCLGKIKTHLAWALLSLSSVCFIYDLVELLSVLGPFEETIKSGAVRLLVLLLLVVATCSFRSRCRSVWNGFSRSSGSVGNSFACSPRTALPCRWHRLFCLSTHTCTWALLCLLCLGLWCRLRIVVFGWFHKIGFLPLKFGICCSRSFLVVPILLSFPTITIPLTRGRRETWVEKVLT